jgi:hypothetical protein
LGRDQETQNRAAVRFRDDVEYRFHVFNIPTTAYTCQGIYNRSETPTPSALHGSGEQLEKLTAEHAEWGCSCEVRRVAQPVGTV